MWKVKRSLAWRRFHQGCYDYQDPEDRSDRGRVNGWLKSLEGFLEQELHAGSFCDHKKGVAHSAQDSGSFVLWSHNVFLHRQFGPYLMRCPWHLCCSSANSLCFRCLQLNGETGSSTMGARLHGVFSMLWLPIVRIPIGTVAVPSRGIVLSIVWIIVRTIVVAVRWMAARWITVRRREQIFRYVTVIIASNNYIWHFFLHLRFTP